MAREEQYAQETRQYLDSPEGVTEARQAFANIKAALEQQMQAIAEEHSWNYQPGQAYPDYDFEFRFAGLRLRVTFQHYSNSVRDCALVAEFSRFSSSRWQQIASDTLGVTRTPALGLCWHGGHALSSVAVAERWLNKMLDLRRGAR